MAHSHETPMINVEVTKGGTILNKRGDGPHMLFSPEAWQEFVRDIQEGKYDLPKE